MTIPPIPTLPAGLTFAFPLPGIATVFDIKLCCKVFQFPVGAVLPPIGITLSSPIITSLNVLIKQINGYFDLLPVLCPRE